MEHIPYHDHIDEVVLEVDQVLPDITRFVRALLKAKVGAVKDGEHLRFAEHAFHLSTLPADEWITLCMRPLVCLKPRQRRNPPLLRNMAQDFEEVTEDILYLVARRLYYVTADCAQLIPNLHVLLEQCADPSIEKLRGLVRSYMDRRWYSIERRLQKKKTT